MSIRTSALALVALASAPARASTLLGTCDVSVLGGTITCPDDLADRLWIERDGASAMTVGIDMDGLYAVMVAGRLGTASGWTLNLGDSETNNGYCGDSRSTSNDAEFWLLNGETYLCDSDRGGSDYLWKRSMSIASGQSFALIVADGQIMFQNLATRDYEYLASPTIFQVDGDEPDAEAGRNDALLYLGLNRVVWGSGRTGTGAESVIVRLYAP